MRMQRKAIGILVLVLAIPTVAIAQNPPDNGPVSVDTPNDKWVLGNYYNVVPDPILSGKMRVRINLRSTAPVIEGELDCNPAGERGEVVAKRAVDALCTDAVSSGLFCTGINLNTGATATGSAACAATFAPTTNSVYITCKTLDNVLLSLSRLANDYKFNVLTSGTRPTGGTQVVGFQTDCGNTIAEDLWPWVMVQLVPNDVDGTVSYDVYYPAGGTTPLSFSVNTALYDSADLEDLHEAIEAGLNGLGLGLNAEAISGDTAKGYSKLVDPSKGWWVVIRNAKAKITEIRSHPLKGQSSEIQTGDPWNIPTLSEWGIFFVVALLLATGYWMLRRRKQAAGRA